MIDGLKPEKVFKYFMEICDIPHGSGNLKQISDYCVEYAVNHGFYYRQDESLNVIIKAPGSAGYENVKPVIIQGHMDMVCVKDDDCQKDLEKEGLDLFILKENGEKYLSAKGTTLGGDDGIAIAIAMAIMDDETVVHPPIEAVFTVDEEVGMNGALSIDLHDIEGNTMLNLDSEEEGILLSSCAGGASVECIIDGKREEKNVEACTVRIYGVTGGHSGTDIIKGGASANALMGRLISNIISDEYFRDNFELIDVNGGEKDNAIPISCEMTCTVNDEKRFEAFVQKFYETVKIEYRATDKDMKISVKSVGDRECAVFNKEFRDKTAMALLSYPQGVIDMSSELPGLVETSLNMGILRTKADGIHMSYSVRSSVKSEKKALIDKLIFMTEYLGGKCEISGDYPAWEYLEKSKLREICVLEYKKLFGSDAKVEAIHAGVECGIMAEKISGLDCVSMGPDIKDIHTTAERLSISSVERTYTLVLAILKDLCENLD